MPRKLKAKDWERILTEQGLSMNRGLSEKEVYVGTSQDLGKIAERGKPSRKKPKRQAD